MNPLSSIYQRIVIAQPWFAVLFVVVLTVFSAYYGKNFKVDSSADALILEGDKDLEFFRGVIDEFGTSEFLVVAYELIHPMTSDKSLEAIDLLSKDLAKVEGVSGVVSVLDVHLLYSPKVSITDLGGQLSTLRDTTVDRSLAQKEFSQSPIYRQLLTSLDESTTVLQVSLVPDLTQKVLLDERQRLRKLNYQDQLDQSGLEQLARAEAAYKNYAVTVAENQKRLVEDVRAVLNQHRGEAKNIFLGGVPMIANDMVAFVLNDLQSFGLGILVFIVILLTIIFREVRWVVLPMIACMVTNVVMFGVLGFFDWRMTVISSNFVALLLIITLAIAVHLIVRYRELEAEQPYLTPKALAFETVKQMLRPCIYTVLTTVIAFASLVISGIRPVIDFGWMMTTGVFIAITVAFIVVPAGMALGFGAGRMQAAAKGRDDLEESDSTEGVFTLWFASFAEKYGRFVLLFALSLLVFAVVGITKLKVENRFIDYFNEKTEIYQGMELIDSQLGGTIPLDIILMPSLIADTVNDDYADEEFDDDEFAEEDFEAATDDEFADEFADEFGEETDSADAKPEWFTRVALERVERLHDHLESLPQTGKILSLATLYKVAGDLLNGSVDDIQLSFAKNSLPAEVDDLLIKPYLNEESGRVRLNVRVKETSRALNRNEFLQQLDQTIQEDLGFAKEDYRLTGMLVLYNNMLQSLFASQILTLGTVFIAICAMLYVLFRSVSLALLGIAPNLLAALMVLGAMGWFGLPLDLMTITIAAISIGIGVDNTIHYIYRYRTEIAKDGDYIAAMYRSHGSIGRAMYYTSLTIIFGFSILALSNFKPSIYFGLLTGAAMLSALLGALLLLPRLLILFKPFGQQKS